MLFIGFLAVHYSLTFLSHMKPCVNRLATTQLTADGECTTTIASHLKIPLWAVQRILKQWKSVENVDGKKIRNDNLLSILVGPISTRFRSELPAVHHQFCDFYGLNAKINGRTYQNEVLARILALWKERNPSGISSRIGPLYMKQKRRGVSSTLM